MARQLFLVDDHPVMRYGLAALIGGETDLEVCGEAGSAAEALAAFAENIPDLALIDLTLPDKNGLELIKDIRAMHEQLLVLVVSMHDENLYAERALRAGARGYVMKEEAPGQLIGAIRRVLDGGIFVSDHISARIVQQFASGGGGAKLAIDRLTDRELEVFRLIGEGSGSREIAGHLNISVRTVDAHRAHIKEKLDLKDGTELVHRAVRWVETGDLV